MEVWIRVIYTTLLYVPTIHKIQGINSEIKDANKPSFRYRYDDIRGAELIHISPGQNLDGHDGWMSTQNWIDFHIRNG